MKTFLYLLACLSAFLLVGCILDGEEDKPWCKNSEYLLYWDYQGDQLNEDLFPRRVESICLFAYNTAGELVFNQSISRQQITRSRTFKLNLPKGDYRLVFWANALDQTQITGSENRETFRLTHPNHQASNPIAGNDSLCFAYKEITLTAASTVVPDTVWFVAAHYKIHLRVSGLYPPHVAWPDPQFQLTGVPDMYNGYNQNINEKDDYWPVIYKDDKAQEHYSKFNLLRFPIDTPIAINLIDAKNNSSFYSLSLPEFISRHQISVENKKEVEIAIRFIINGFYVQVEPWQAETIKPGH